MWPRRRAYNAGFPLGIMIAHRMATVENCDDVVRLDGMGLKDD